MSRSFKVGLLSLGGGLILLLLISYGVKYFLSQPVRYAVHSDLAQALSRDFPLLIRTDFSNDESWQSTLDQVGQRLNLGIVFTRANLEVVVNPALRDLPAEQIAKRLSADYRQDFGYFLMVDKMTIEHAEHPVLVVDFYEGELKTFRAIPREIALIENNLTLANMDFEDFSDYVDADGIYRGIE